MGQYSTICRARFGRKIIAGLRDMHAVIRLFHIFSRYFYGRAECARANMILSIDFDDASSGKQKFTLSNENVAGRAS